MSGQPAFIKVHSKCKFKALSGIIVYFMLGALLQSFFTKVSKIACQSDHLFMFLVAPTSSGQSLQWFSSVLALITEVGEGMGGIQVAACIIW